MRTWMMRALAAAFTALFVSAALAQYPARPVRLIVSIPPGGAPDIAARVLGQKLTESLAPDVKDKLNVAGGLEPFATTPDQYTALIRSDHKKYGKLVKDIGVRVE